MYQERIKSIRAKLNLSVAKLANKIKIPARTITGYERGERTPSIEFLANLSTILNINANWFISGKGEMFIQPEKNFAAEYEDVKEDILKKVQEMLKEKGL